MSQSYVLDPTGTSPNNLVSNDIFTVTPNSNTAIVPTAGMYFANSLVVTDSNTGAIKTRNTDFICIELSGEMTGKYGQEINAAVLWLGTGGTTSISLQYQCLGGGNNYNNTQLQELIQSTVATSQQLEWYNILNKPNLYTPNNHVNMLSDIYGFEPVVYAIERLSKLINLGNTASFQALIDWVTQQVGNVNNPNNLVSYGDLLNTYQNNVNAQLLSIENLVRDDNPYTNKTLYSLIDDSNINIVNYTLTNVQLNLNLDYTYLPNGFKVFWELETPDSTIGNYYYPSAGSINAAIDTSTNTNSNLSLNLNGPLLFNTSLTFSALNTKSNDGIIISWYDLNSTSVSNLNNKATLSNITTTKSFKDSYNPRVYNTGSSSTLLFDLTTYKGFTTPTLLRSDVTRSTSSSRYYRA